MTLEEQLAAEKAETAKLSGSITAITSERDTLQGKVTAAEAKATEAEQKLSAAAKEKTELQTKLSASEAEVARLSGEAKTVEKKAAEIVAKSGTDPVEMKNGGTGGDASTTPARDNPWITGNTTHQIAMKKTDAKKAERLQAEAKTYKEKVAKK